MHQDKLIEVGFIAYRNPQTGEFMSSMPLYERETKDLRASQDKFLNELKSTFVTAVVEYIKANQSTKPTLEGREPKLKE